MEVLTEGVTGGVGGLVGRIAAFPFDTLKVKLATAEPGVGFADIFAQMIREEGIAGFYRGLPFSALEALLQKANYAVLAASLKAGFRQVTGNDIKDVTPLANVACGYLSDLGGVPFMMPLEAMVVRLQSAPSSASRSAIVRESLFTRDGLITSIKSGRAYFVLSLKPGIEFAIFERLKQRILAARDDNVDNLSPGTAFLLGAFARAIATLILYPYARGKSLAQARMAPTAATAVARVLKTEGVFALYKGLGMELLRGASQSAVMFAVMEQIRNFVCRLLLRPTTQRKT